MALITEDRVLETSTTTGSGALTLLGFVAGYRAASDVCANGDTFYYYIEGVDSNGNPNGSGWETGLGTWGTGNIFTRTTVSRSSNANVAVVWGAGTRRVAMALTAALLATKESTSNKDASGGYTGLTLFKINFKNALNTFTSFFTNAATAARTYTFPDKDITVAGLVDITGGTSAGSFTTLSATGNITVGGSIKGSYGSGAITSNFAAGDGALVNNTTGNQNTATGVSALSTNTTGNYNTATGYNALFTNTTGDQNTATGYNALSTNTTGNYNTATGYNALVTNTTGYQNTATGVNALVTNTTGNYNTATGVSALVTNTTGNYNTANGGNALFTNTTGNYNTANGLQSLYRNTTGDQNTATGYSALFTNTTGYQNTATGVSALSTNTTGYQNTATGYNALFTNTTGNYNTATGYNALVTNTTGYQNTATGYNALNEVRPTSKAISAFANYGATVAGTVKATSVAHGLAGTTTKEITGTVNYNGAKSVTVIDVDNFYFTATWVATETGWWSIVTEGINNTAFGYNTGRGITIGSGNTVLGANVTGLVAGLTNNIILANGAGTIKARHDGTSWAITDAVAVTGTLSATATISTGGYTVATLPAGTVGDRAYVTDATAPLYNTALTGGGAVRIPVFRNATVWVSA